MVSAKGMEIVYEVNKVLITIDTHRMFLNAPVISWLSLEHSMDKCGYLGMVTLT